MKATITISDALYEQATRLAEPGLNKSALFEQALKVFIQIQAAKRLAALGGSAPEMPVIPRRRNPLP